ncbi:MAG: 2-succinyl-5-enolpyruvyl-6-hydroxy-3-cyclohexene-1-carboxylic-acid synthase [Chloroflexi bacterium]|nr:2-succinyl-5-enolpyruvyl-6-hydroxy-3-cyclohexene-1-carboxylic-acid synthase [Chloroflexota bacterium]
MPQATYLAAGALIDELARSGVRHVCVSPGSRSTPLALLAAEHPDLRLWVHLDERSSSYFALGMAKVLGEPVALVCTSGTAAANFAPAVVEARYGRVPLVVLTADRPHELRDIGASQTIDQVHLYGWHAKWFFDLEEPDASDEFKQVRHTRTVVCRAVATAREAPAGPVHVNCPFREPLVPEPVERGAGAQGRADGRPYVWLRAAPRRALPEQLASLTLELVDRPRGVIVCGPRADPGLAGPVVALADRLGYPVLADPLSGVRRAATGGPMVLDAYDAFLRDSATVERLRPDVVLRVGAMPAARTVAQYLQRYAGCRLIVVDEDGWNEPTGLATDLVHADAGLLCEDLARALPAELGCEPARRAWLSSWQHADRAARSAIQATLASMDEMFEGRVFAELGQLLPADALLFAGNSMPVRDLDTFLAADGPPLRCLANRGASGIDGVVSTALGASAAADRALVLVIGDISLYHDANGLLAARQYRLNATIVLLNNDGGGIFSFLSQAARPEHFETLFGTPHGLDFQPLLDTYGGIVRRPNSWAEFRCAVEASLSEGGLQVVEVRTDRQRNVLLHRQVWEAVSVALEHQPA